MLFFATTHFTEEYIYSYIAVPLVLLLVLVYIFSPQINWWWYSRNPEEVPPSLRKILETRMPFYQILSPQEQEKFRHRLGLFLMGNEFIPKGGDSEKVPEDIQLIIAANACQITLGETNLLLPKFEHVVVYAHPFPSPQYHDWHVSELFEEDGVILFSAEHLMKSFMEPQTHFNIGLYEYAKAFRLQYPKYTYPTTSDVKWADIQQISGFTQERLEAWIGLKNLDIVAIAMALFFTHPQEFKQKNAFLYRHLERLFKRA